MNQVFSLVDNRDYYAMLNEIKTRGGSLESRLGTVSEVLNCTIEFPAGRMFYRPGLSRKLAWTETLQIIGGFFDASAMAKAAPNLKYEYTPQQAYGLHIAPQMKGAIDALNSSQNTRRAVVYIGGRDDPGDIEKPCLSMIQYQVRQGILMTSIYIRSWDLISGFIYDTHSMGALSQAVASCTSTRAGIITCFVGNAHIYEADIQRGHFPRLSGPMPKHFDLPRFSQWEEYITWAKSAASGWMDHPEAVLVTSDI